MGSAFHVSINTHTHTHTHTHADLQTMQNTRTLTCLLSPHPRRSLARAPFYVLPITPPHPMAPHPHYSVPSFPSLCCCANRTGSRGRQRVAARRTSVSQLTPVNPKHPGGEQEETRRRSLVVLSVRQDAGPQMR